MLSLTIERIIMMITVITGAGVSASAGIPTYRAQNSLWHDEKFHKYSHAKEYGNHLDYLKPKWLDLLTTMKNAEPTDFHRLVAEKEWNVVTQNVDGLHQKAGSQKVVEIHGSLLKWRRLKATSDNTFSADLLQNINGDIVAPFESKNDNKKAHDNSGVESSLTYSGRIRPDIVLFGERLKNLDKALELVKWSDVVIYAGTSGNVYPVADWYVYSQGRTILVDPVGWGNFDKYYPSTSDEWASAFDNSFLE